jgi:predicted phosphoribosyltransferase
VIPVIFHDREQAGRELAKNLGRYAGVPDVIVLALPRGGVPVAFEVARALRAPLDVFLVRKLGLPGHPEYAMGALASGEVRVINERLLAEVGVSAQVVERVVEREERELRRRERAYRGDLPALELRGRTAILVDDGVATGSSMLAAVEAVRKRGARKIVVAVPVAPRESIRLLRGSADDVVCVASPEPFLAVGRFYADFEQTSDEEVLDLLERARAGFAADVAVSR